MSITDMNDSVETTPELVKSIYEKSRLNIARYKQIFKK